VLCIAGLITSAVHGVVIDNRKVPATNARLGTQVIDKYDIKDSPIVRELATQAELDEVATYNKYQDDKRYQQGMDVCMETGKYTWSQAHAYMVRSMQSYEIAEANSTLIVTPTLARRTGGEAMVEAIRQSTDMGNYSQMAIEMNACECIHPVRIKGLPVFCDNCKPIRVGNIGANPNAV
jgi:hypothetical protein